MDSNLVRVSANGQHVNVGRGFAESRKLRVLKEATHDKYGNPLPPSEAPKSPAKSAGSTNTATKRAATAEEASK